MRGFSVSGGLLCTGSGPLFTGAVSVLSGWGEGGGVREVVGVVAECSGWVMGM